MHDMCMLHVRSFWMFFCNDDRSPLISIYGVLRDRDLVWTDR